RTLLDRHPQQLLLPPGWGEPAVRTRRPARRPRLLVLVAVFLVVAVWLTGQLTSTRGWLMVALAWVLVLALTGHRDAGGAGRLLRMLGEYAAVAVLAVLLVTGSAVGAPGQPAHRGRTTVDAAGQLCPDAIHGIAGAACDLIGDVWRQAKCRSAKQTPTTTTGRNRR
ncbi:MAG TPA: hypothetical protein VGM21_16020, partial [Actinomycetota bacterium]